MSSKGDLYKAKAQVLKALAHPSRLMIVDELCKGEKCVCELQEAVGSDMSTVSRHLSVMKAAGMVSDRRVGNHVFYSLAIPCVTDLLQCIEAVLREELKSRIAAVGGA
ncbi:MAG: ArsR/SmtB family transcription factor [Armatimonadota bacterium]